MLDARVQKNQKQTQRKTRNPNAHPDQPPHPAHPQQPLPRTVLPAAATRALMTWLHGSFISAIYHRNILPSTVRIRYELTSYELRARRSSDEAAESLTFHRLTVMICVLLRCGTIKWRYTWSQSLEEAEFGSVST